MFHHYRFGTYILHFMIEKTTDKYSHSVSDLSNILEFSKISLDEFYKIINRYPSVSIYKNTTVWIENIKEANQLVEELNTLITLTGVRKIYA